MNDKVWRLQAELSSMPQIELETSHFFADGMYARVVKRPFGALIVGKVHKKEHFYIITKGKVAVFSEGEVKTYEAGEVVVSKPGTKRAVFALEDSICMTVHRTDKTDLEEIERELLEEDQTALFDANNKLLEDRADYFKLLKETGFTLEERRRISENPEDQIPMPHKWSVSIAPSKIEGMGVFADIDFKDGEVIAPARIGDKRTPLGRYANHAISPNARMDEVEDTIYAVACKDIKAGEEITVNYRFHMKHVATST